MKHQWTPSDCLGPIQLCSLCPDIWWQWADPNEPTTECVPITQVFWSPYPAVPQGEVA